MGSVTQTLRLLRPIFFVIFLLTTNTFRGVINLRQTMGTDNPIEMVLVMVFCLFGIATTTKGPNLQTLELVGDISVQCNSDIDCPIGLICQKNACGKPSS